MKIGIGAITYNRPLHLKHWINQAESFRPDNSDLFISDDSKNRKGIAFRSNEILRKFKDHDFIFIFNDDAFIIKKGWAEYFIEASFQSGIQHFCLMKESNETKITGYTKDNEITDSIQVNIFDKCNGSFLFMTKECINRVGAFNEKYFYGFEHADYSNRIHRAGLTRYGAYCCPKDSDKYIYNLDIEPESDLHRKLKHKSSMTSIESLGHVKKAFEIYKQPTEIFLPL